MHVMAHHLVKCVDMAQFWLGLDEDLQKMEWV